MVCLLWCLQCTYMLPPRFFCGPATGCLLLSNLGAFSTSSSFSSPFPEYASWYFWVYAHVRLLRKQSSALGWGVRCPPIGLGLEGKVQKNARGGEPHQLGQPQQLEKIIFTT